MKSKSSPMDVSKNGPNEFERTSKNRRPFWMTLISFWTSRGRLFVSGRSVPTGLLFIIIYLNKVK